MSAGVAGRQARGAVADSRTSHADSPPGPVAPCAGVGGPAKPAPKTPGHWIEVVLVDEDGRPVKDVAWRVTAADGKVFEGRTDETGVANVPELAPGPARVAFPELDGRSWSPA